MRFLADGDQLVGALEVVVGEAVHVGFEQQVGVVSPLQAHAGLRDGEALADDVEETAAALAAWFQCERRWTPSTQSMPICLSGVVGTS